MYYMIRKNEIKKEQLVMCLLLINKIRLTSAYVAADVISFGVVSATADIV